MDRIEAAKLDQGSKYVDYDTDTTYWGVFGTESGFCYSLHTDEEEANRACTRGTAATSI